MGLYFVNIRLVGDPEHDPGRPEIVIDKPLPNGRLRLIGADFLVLANAGDALHPGQPPQIISTTTRARAAASAA